MTRPLRIEFEGALYHVMSRGNAKQNIFIEDHDREKFLSFLGSTITKMEWICHGYCLMPNHYHLIIETPRANLSKGMAVLNGSYTQSFNRRHNKVGHVFQGRFKSILVEKNTYLKELIRYVALNPVRSGLVKRAEDFKWNSYRAIAGIDPRPEWLNVDWSLSCFASSKKKARKEYAEFVEEGLKWDMELEKEVKHQMFLGSDEFITDLQETYLVGKDLSEAPREQRQIHTKTLDYYEGKYPDRKEAMIQAYLSGQFTLREVGDHFGMHYSTVSRAVKEFLDK